MIPEAGPPCQVTPPLGSEVDGLPSLYIVVGLLAQGLGHRASSVLGVEREGRLNVDQTLIDPGAQSVELLALGDEHQGGEVLRGEVLHLHDVDPGVTSRSHKVPALRLGEAVLRKVYGRATVGQGVAVELLDVRGDDHGVLLGLLVVLAYNRNSHAVKQFGYLILGDWSAPGVPADVDHARPVVRAGAG